MTSRALAVLALVSLCHLASCSCAPEGSGDDAGTPRLDAPRPDAPRFDAPVDAMLPPGVGPFFFRRGVNPGYYGSGIDRRESAELSANAGITSLRTTLPERYLAMWGDGIEVGDYAFYAEHGLDDHVVFLIGPSAAHSSAPSGTPEWELDHWAPTGLYEQIFLSDGSVNPDNHWASYVDRVATTYADHVLIYEVWNEPDQVLDNWMATTEWDTRAPTATELVWWNDTIYAYVRALRITHEVVHRADPEAMVTVGGVGYPNFLRAVLRYTDEPTAGAVDAEHPETGGAYLDVLSFHYYPVFGGGSSDRGVEGFLEQHDAMQAVLDEAGLGDLGMVCTETGAPRRMVGTTPGSDLYAASYLVKVMTLAHYAGMVGVDWFAQGDGTAARQATDSFASMGLYFDYSMATSPADVVRSPQGDAYEWTATWLEDSGADDAGLAALALPADVRGAAFRRSDGSRLVVLWAHTTGDESATATYDLATDADVRVRTFSLGGGSTDEMRSPTGGVVTLALGSMPIAVDLP